MPLFGPKTPHEKAAPGNGGTTEHLMVTLAEQIVVAQAAVEESERKKKDNPEHKLFVLQVRAQRVVTRREADDRVLQVVEQQVKLRPALAEVMAAGLAFAEANARLAALVEETRALTSNTRSYWLEPFKGPVNEVRVRHFAETCAQVIEDLARPERAFDRDEASDPLDAA